MTDRLATILVVGGLGALGIIAGTALIVKGHPEGVGVATLGGTAIGGLLPSPLSKSTVPPDAPQPVNVVNQPTDPVPVDPSP